MRAEVIQHEQVKANELITEYDHPVLGRVRQPRAAALFETGTLRQQPIAPSLGQHNSEVLGELGYSQAEIQGLAAEGVISTVG
jgi:crotonobetainyl-CoA:carnitine CoA-transferase CaiB-like acyl-CoA transferase